MSNWTTNAIPDLSGKVIIVTGANSGIGFESAKEFARNGAEVILACRNMDKAEAAVHDIKKEIPSAKAIIMQLDLASQKSVHQFASEFKANYDRLDVLLNNAGIMWVEYGVTEDGFERQFGTNHLGHFALTGLLLDVIMATPGARVVNVSSMGHNTGVIDRDNLMFENGEGYGRHTSYGRTKLANLLFTYELQRRFEAAGVDAIALAAHPGSSNTNLAGHCWNHGLCKFCTMSLCLFWHRHRIWAHCHQSAHRLTRRQKVANTMDPPVSWNNAVIQLSFRAINVHIIWMMHAGYGINPKN